MVFLKKVTVSCLVSLSICLTSFGQVGWSVINKSDTDVLVYTSTGTNPELYVTAGSSGEGWKISPNEVISVLVCWAYQKGNQTGNQGTCISETVAGVIGHTLKEPGSITISDICRRNNVNGIYQCRNLPILQFNIPLPIIMKKKPK